LARERIEARAVPAILRERRDWRFAQTLTPLANPYAAPYAIEADLAVVLGRYAHAIELLRAALREQDEWLLRVLLGMALAQHEPYASDGQEFQVCHLPGAGGA
jgi:hypothetical protein